MTRTAGRPSIAPNVVTHLQSAGYGTPKTIAEAIGAHPKSISRLLKTMIEEGILAQDSVTGAYYVARDDEGVPQRLGLVAA